LDHILLSVLFSVLFYVYFSNTNIVDINSDPSQVFRIDCDASMTTEQTTKFDPMTTEQTTKQTTKYDPMTTTTSTQTTESLQSTIKRTKEDSIGNDQITGNIIGIHVVNRDDNGKEENNL
jgi:hypothetical protein